VKQQRIYNVFLLLILLIAFALRTINLGAIPKGLQSDEASFLINSVSIMETAKDEDDKFLPLYLSSLIDSKPALYSYLQIPFIKVSGATTAASRFPSALIGTFSILLFYKLVLLIFKNQRIALVSALMLAVSPWHIMNSRATQEVILSFALILANLIAGHNLFYKKLSKKYLLLFLLTAVLAMYIYHAAKVVLVLFWLGLSFLAFFEKRKTKLEKKSLLKLAIIILFSFLITAQAALTRFSAIGLINDDLPKALIFDYATNSTGSTPLLVIRAFYNKPIMYFKYFLETYLAHFDLNYLFTSGGATRRFSVPLHGLFYMFELLLIPLGIFSLLKKHSKQLLPWLLFLIISPIPAALTTEEIPSSIRAFTILIPLTIATALGFEWLLDNLGKKTKYIFVPIALGILTWSVAFFVQQFFIIMPIKNTLYRSRSYEVVSEQIAQIQDQYDAVQFTSDLREMYIYLWQQDLITIEQIQSKPMERYNQNYNLGKYYFSQVSCSFNNIQSNSLLVAPYNCAETLTKRYDEIGTADFDDETPGFILLSNQF